MDDPFLVNEWPPKMTSAGVAFRHEHLRVFRFFTFVIKVAQDIDDATRRDLTFLKKLEEVVDLGAEGQHLDPTQVDSRGALATFTSSYGRQCREMILVRCVDNFLIYVTDLLTSIFRNRPSAMKSEETVRLDELLQHSSMDALIHHLAERKVARLSYLGTRKLAAKLSKSLGFDLFASDDALLRASRIVEGRNLLVHARGIVNRTYLDRVAGSTQKIGDALRFGAEALMADARFIATSVVDIDARAAAKFGVSQDSPVESPVDKGAV